jgi:type IV secretory pathway component VirB8
MGNIRKERRKQSTFLKVLIIISFGAALLATTLVMMIKEGNTNPTADYKI